ncbi:MAG: hypothetical protein HKN26_06190, partial [Acidimicrobiales bacterium]|nr:hypothetical protein [Acidimicrobiales bacterium]
MYPDGFGRPLEQPQGDRYDDRFDDNIDAGFEDRVDDWDYDGPVRPRRRWRRWVGGFVVVALVLGVAQL